MARRGWRGRQRIVRGDFVYARRPDRSLRDAVAGVNCPIGAVGGTCPPALRGDRCSAEPFGAWRAPFGAATRPLGGVRAAFTSRRRTFLRCARASFATMKSTFPRCRASFATMTSTFPRCAGAVHYHEQHVSPLCTRRSPQRRAGTGGERRRSLVLRDPGTRERLAFTAVMRPVHHCESNVQT